MKISKILYTDDRSYTAAFSLAHKRIFANVENIILNGQYGFTFKSTIRHELIHYLQDKKGYDLHHPLILFGCEFVANWKSQRRERDIFYRVKNIPNYIERSMLSFSYVYKRAGKLKRLFNLKS